MNLEPGAQIKDYVLERHLGTGGQAAVWQAKKSTDGRSYALKFLLPQFASNPTSCELFLKEAEAQLNLVHANIVPAHELVQTPVLALVMDLVNGGTLASRIYGEELDGDTQPETGTPLSIDDALRISIAVLDALDFAHQKGYVHRDPTPTNILMHADGRPMLTDFGIVREMKGYRKTVAGVIQGNVSYMSPEQIQRPATVDFRSDVYSFGCVIYEMVTGRPPFILGSADQDSDPAHVLKMKHIMEEPQDPRRLQSQIPADLAHFIMQALVKDRDKRLPGCGLFRDALIQVRSEMSPNAAAASVGAGSTAPAPPVQTPPSGASLSDSRRLNVQPIPPPSFSTVDAARQSAWTQHTGPWPPPEKPGGGLRWAMVAAILVVAVVLIAWAAWSSASSSTTQNEAPAPTAPPPPVHAQTTPPIQPRPSQPGSSKKSTVVATENTETPLAVPKAELRKPKLPRPAQPPPAQGTETNPAARAPVPVSQPAAEGGSLALTTVPPGLDVYINDVQRAVTPTMIRFQQTGTYHFRVQQGAKTLDNFDVVADGQIKMIRRTYTTEPN